MPCRCILTYSFPCCFVALLKMSATLSATDQKTLIRPWETGQTGQGGGGPLPTKVWPGNKQWRLSRNTHRTALNHFLPCILPSRTNIRTLNDEKLIPARTSTHTFTTRLRMRGDRRKWYGNYHAAPKLAEDHLLSLGENPPVIQIEEEKVASNAVSAHGNPPPHVLFRCRLTVGQVGQRGGPTRGTLKPFAVESPLRSSAILAYQHAAYYLCVRFGIDSKLNLPTNPPKPKPNKTKPRWTAARRAARAAEKAVTAPPPEALPAPAEEREEARFNEEGGGDDTDAASIEDERYMRRYGVVFHDPEGDEFAGLWGGARSVAEDDLVEYPVRSTSPIYTRHEVYGDEFMFAEARNRMVAWAHLVVGSSFGGTAIDEFGFVSALPGPWTDSDTNDTADAGEGAGSGEPTAAAGEDAEDAIEQDVGAVQPLVIHDDETNHAEDNGVPGGGEIIHDAVPDDHDDNNYNHIRFTSDSSDDGDAIPDEQGETAGRAEEDDDDDDAESSEEDDGSEAELPTPNNRRSAPSDESGRPTKRRRTGAT